ncbi:Peptidase M48, Ste24p precursor [Desulfurella amilsii]|uniref:Protease HtpX homolog n=1 Tax=Desulfurella amilsii TaxID=1562698 RepID=A0A1X4XUN3_9BACT|nr:zinc metalloprotease HtpX [Desulfurella amilsii]OSS41218.1 Peptidase M48, Ste24p precursor [Desulfurella amilsii]
MINTVKTALLLGILTALFIVIGNAIGGRSGALIAFALAIGMNFFSYFFSDKIALGIYHAQKVTESEYPALFRIVRKLAQNADLPMPSIYIIPQEAPNAFATGRNPKNAAIAVTAGALRLLNENELMGVLGHELGHIKHRDILISTIAATIAGAIMIIADMIRWAALFGGFSKDRDSESNPFVLIALAIFAPLAATLIQLAISRAREYEADKAGAEFSANPLYLASALEKLENYSKQIPLKGNPATENLFIVNPFSAKGIINLFSTHPPIQERIKRLRQMALV